jgi:hypothetical protein
MDKSKYKPEHLLMEVLNFDEADLEANRIGRLSRDQLEDFSRRWRTMLIAIVFLTIFSPLMFVLTIIVYVNDSNSRDFNGFLFVAIASAFGCLLIASRYKKTNADLNSGKVLFVEGRISFNVGSGRGQSFSVQIQNQIFRVNKEIFLAFKNGDPYVIYYAPNSGTILSVEWLRD